MRSRTGPHRAVAQARSSVGERYIDTVEVGSSILPAPTNGTPSLAGFLHFRKLHHERSGAILFLPPCTTERPPSSKELRALPEEGSSMRLGKRLGASTAKLMRVWPWWSERSIQVGKKCNNDESIGTIMRSFSAGVRYSALSDMLYYTGDVRFI